MKQRKLQQLCEEILLGCCLAQVMASADIRPSYISRTWEHLYNRTQAASSDNYSTRRMLHAYLQLPDWSLANHGVI